jgi:hypothetical protein
MQHWGVYIYDWSNYRIRGSMGLEDLLLGLKDQEYIIGGFIGLEDL